MTAPALPYTMNSTSDNADKLETDPSTTTDLVTAWRELNIPQGWRSEIIQERIVVTPLPDQWHNLAASRLIKGLVRLMPDDRWELCTSLGVSVPSLDELYVPDLAVVPPEAMTSDQASVAGERVLLVAEITSKGTADTDRKTKMRGYAHAGVPLFLLIDRFAEEAPTVFLHSEPSPSGFYRHTHRVPFGEQIKLPEPFGLSLDTVEF